MNIGPFTLNIDWAPAPASPQRPDPDEAVIAFLRDHPAGRELTARMARSEVKNYLAELAEQAEMPFHSPADFLRLVREYASYSAAEPDALVETPPVNPQEPEGDRCHGFR